jgi:hypothetical protein
VLDFVSQITARGLSKRGPGTCRGREVWPSERRVTWSLYLRLKEKRYRAEFFSYFRKGVYPMFGIIHSQERKLLPSGFPYNNFVTIFKLKLITFIKV